MTEAPAGCVRRKHEEQKKLMKIACSNCRANCARALLVGSVVGAAPPNEPSLAAGLRNAGDYRICLAQTSSTESPAKGGTTGEESARR